MNRLQRLLLPLLIIGTALIINVIGVAPSFAVFLNDIRVGEYDSHTRIVLELSESATIERITPRDPGQLTVIFTDTHPRLTRKIPLENTRRVKNLKLWHRKGNLSLLLTFAFDHFRYELTHFKNPVRVALDVYQLTSAPPKPDALEPGAFTDSDQLAKLPDAATPVEPALPAKQTIQPPSVERAADDLRKDPTANKPAQVAVPEPEFPKTKRHAAPSLPGPTEESTSPSSPSEGSSGLQFFLVVGLVTITIIILILLLLMMLSKNRWADTSRPLTTNESLKKQDERIAALNAQVHEQLKRYDEA